MVKTTKILLALLISIILLSMTSMVSADTYTFSLRNGESATEPIVYSNGNAQTMNVTFEIVNYSSPGTAHANNDRDGEINFVFDPVTITVEPSASVETNLTLTITDQADLGEYTADVQVNETPTNGGASTTTVIHNLRINVVANIPPTISNIDDFNMNVGETATEIVTIEDAEGDDLTFDLTNAPSGMTATPIDNNTVNITWSPSTAVAERTVTFSVNDGTNTTEQEFQASAILDGLYISIEDIEFGDENQEREEFITKDFTITNIGSDIISGLNIEAAGFDSNYNFTIEISPASTIQPGSSTTFRTRLYVPDDQDSNIDDIGTLYFNYNDNIQSSKKAYLTTKSFLKISDAEMEVEGDDDNVDEGDTIDMEIGDEVKFIIEIENNNDDYNFEDEIEIELKIDNLDIDETFDYEDDLDHGDDTGNDIEFEFTVPSDEDDGVMDVIVTITGKDENGAEHETIFEFNLDVERPNDFIKINDLTFLSEQVKTGKTAQLEIEIENAGEDNQDEVYIKIENDMINYVKLIGELSLDDGDEMTRTVTIPIPEDAEVGDYLFTVTTYHETDEESDIESVLLTVLEGTTTPTTTPSIAPTTIVNTTPTPTVPSNAAYGEPIQKSFFGSDTSIMVLLIILIVVIIGVIVVILIPAKR